MENNYKTIKYKDSDIKLLQYLSESNSDFDKRLEFIKKLENDNVSSDKAVKLSRLWYCIKNKNCKYPPEIYNNIKKYL